MKWRLFCLIFLQLVAWIGLEATEWKILVPEDAIPAEITAAQELQAGLKKIFGKEFPVMHGEGEPPKRARQGFGTEKRGRSCFDHSLS